MDPESDRIAEALDRWLAAGCRAAYPAWGQAVAEPQATVSGTTRIVLALGGRNRMHIPQDVTVREILLRAGEAVVVDRLAWNRPLHVHPFSFLTIDLMSDYIRLYLRAQAKAGMQPSQVTQLFLRGGADPALRAAADAAEALTRSADGTLLGRAAWLAVACTRRQLDRPRLVADPAWQLLREWIEDHLHEPGLGRSAVARACAIHPGHVSRVMARAAGCGFAAWVNRRRTERASDLLAGSDLPVAEVGRRCGFSSAAYFNHAFRTSTGTSPGRWRTARSLS
jgi:AraC-like DNA-binding protein